MRRDEIGAVGLLAGGVLVWHVVLGVYVARAAGIPLEQLGLYFDGHLYLEIARSFPLPYAVEGLDYAGQAPGYPALAFGLRLLLPDALVSWGLALLVAAWLPAALAAAAFYCVCRAADVQGSALLAAASFAALNPRWVAVGATPHPEPLAMLLLLGALLAYLRERLSWCMALLSLAGLVRFPALLAGLAFAFGVIVLRRQTGPRAVGLLALPVAVFALWNGYLYLRIPEFPGIAAAHRVFWDTSFTLPFAALFEHAERWLWPPDHPLFELTYATALGYTAAALYGLRPGERALWPLAVWVGAFVLVHASLSGGIGAFDFTRLTVLAWPAAWLIAWRAGVWRAPAPVLALLCVAGVAFGSWFTGRQAAGAMAWQQRSQHFLAEKDLQSDVPDWIDFRARGAERPRRPR